ncbi:MAG: hypothetical protein ABIH08_01435 [Candidatus Omnitrophota bacterium]
MEKVITFSKEAKIEILHFFNKDVDRDGYIIEKDTGERIPGSDGEPVEFEHFAGIRRGSLVFVKSDINSIIELVDSMNQ